MARAVSRESRVGDRAARDQRARLDRVVQAPHDRAALRRRLGRDGAQRHADRGVVVKQPCILRVAGTAGVDLGRTIGRALRCRHHHVLRQRQPLGRRVRTEGGRQRPHGIGRGLHALEAAALAHIGTDALHRGRLDRRAHVIGDEAANRPCERQFLVAREHEADQPAHAGADVVEHVDGLLAVQPGQQRHHVGRVHGHLIEVRIAQPVAAPAPDHVGAHHAHVAAGARHDGLGQRIEIAPLPGQAVHADHDMRAACVAPLPIGHAMAALGVVARHVMKRRFGHENEVVLVRIIVSSHPNSSGD
jgi:hypothetical protein